MSVRLLAPPPGWTTSADVVVVGSGVAGLTAALHAATAVGAVDGSVLLVTKVLVDDGSTRWAQGGVAAALGADDSPEDHLHDTLVAGVGLCDVAAARSRSSLAATADELAELGARTCTEPSPAAWEATDLHAVATAVDAAARREETRGAHWRGDHPEAAPAWRGRLVTTLSGTTFEPIDDEEPAA